MFFMKFKKSLFILFFATILIYFNSLGNEFIFDDISLVLNSSFLNNATISDLISSYRPLRYITYFIDYHIFGMNPWGFRLMNVFYHVLTTLSVLWLLRLLKLGKTEAFIGALIFAIHPIHVDAVSYISGRRDILTALFYILSLGFFIRFYDKDNSPQPSLKKREGARKVPLFFKEGLGELLLSIIMMVLSISSKETGATIPIAWLLYIFFREGKSILKKQWFYILSLVVLLLFSFFAFRAIQTGGSGLISLNGVRFHGNSMLTHYMTAITIFIYYIKQTIFPLQLILDNANYPLVTEFNLKVVFSILGILSYIGLMFVLLRKGERKGRSYGLIAFFLMFFVLTLAPVLQIIPLHEIVAEHYLYLPSVAFSGVVGIIVSNAWESLTLNPSPKGEGQITITRLHDYTIITLFTIMIIFFGWRTITRNQELKNHWTVLHADKEWRPLSFRGLFTLGAQYMNMKFPDKAAKYYKKAEKTGYWDGNLFANFIGYNIIKGNHKEALRLFRLFAEKGEYVTDNGRLNIAILLMIDGKCHEAEEIVRRMHSAPLRKKKINIVKKCSQYGFNQFGDSFKSIYSKQEKLKDLGLDVERKPYLKKLIERGEFKDEELIDLIDQMAKVNFISDIPEAIKYYKLEKKLLEKLEKKVPEILNKTISALEDYSHKVLVEGKYYKLEF